MITPKHFATALVSSLFLATFMVVSPVQAESLNSIWTRDLRVGSTGSDVVALQQLLVARGYAIPAGATGYFGGQTQAALARFQASAGIHPAAGYFGPLTRAALAIQVVLPTPQQGGTSTSTTTTESKTNRVIKVELTSGKANVRVTENGKTDTFTLATTNRDRIIETIAKKLSRSESEVRDVTTFTTTRTDTASNVTTSAKVMYTDGPDSDSAAYTIGFDLSAVNQDVYIARNPSVSVDYQIEDGDGNVVAAYTSLSANFRSTAEMTGTGYYLIRDGQKEHFTLMADLDPLAADEGKYFRLRMLAVRFNDTATAPSQTWTTSSEKYATDYVNIPD